MPRNTLCVWQSSLHTNTGVDGLKAAQVKADLASELLAKYKPKETESSLTPESEQAGEDQPEDEEEEDEGPDQEEEEEEEEEEQEEQVFF